jgi:WD40 repeat protein/serine/threonine protein kinase
MTHNDRNLIFAILAVQMNFTSRDAVMAGMSAWMLAKHRSLGRILVEQGALSASRHDLLEQLVDEHLAAQESHIEQSLAAANALGARPPERRLEPTEAEPNNGLAPECGPTLSIGGEATLAFPGERVADGLRFAILRPHATGGLGQVSVALDRELNREVALKEIRPEHADNPESRARFLLEAEVTGRLEHPGIVPVYGLGCDAAGRPFYAMRFVRGRRFKEEIERFHEAADGLERDRRQGNLKLRALLNRFVAVCNVVAYAHSRGVVHRDLKPSNILLGPYGETLVVDWGLAKVVGRAEAAGESAAAEATLRPAAQSGSGETLPGLALGTPAYMSPEQAEGRLDDITPLSDVYSLGATLYTVLTGRLPYHDPDVAVVLRQVRNGDLIAPRRVNRLVPAGLEAICLKAMAVHARGRYPSARALADDLEHWLADEPIVVYREPLSLRLTRWGRRHRTLATSIGVLLITAVAGLAVGTILLGRANQRTENQRAFADKQRRLAELKTGEAHDKSRALEHRLYIHRVNLAQREALTDIARAEQLLSECRPGSRGWEWDYVRRSCHQEQSTLRGHTRPVNAVAFSPDGRRVVSGAGERYYDAFATQDAELILWDVQSGRDLRRLEGLKGAIFSAAFSPDGRLLAAGSGYQRSTNIFEGHLSVWDAASGRLVYDRPEPTNNVLSVAFSPDSRLIAAGYGRYSSDNPGHLKLWDATSGLEAHVFPPSRGGVNCVRFSPDGRRVATGRSEVIEIWDVNPPGKVREWTGHASWIYAMAYSPDGTRLATGGWDRTVKVWDAASGSLLSTGSGNIPIISALAFSPDGKRLASSDEGHTVAIWDPATGREISTLRGHVRGVVSLDYSPDGRSLVTGGEDHLVKLWDVSTVHPVTFRDHRGWVTSLAISPDGRRILSSSGDRTLRIWDPATGQQLQALPKQNEWVFAAAASPDGRHLASCAADLNISLWDTATLSNPKSLGPLENFPHCLAFSPDGTRLAVGTASMNVLGAQTGLVRIWEVPSGREVFAYRGHTGGVFALAFSPDGKTIASVGGDRRTSLGEARVWETATGRDRFTLAGDQNLNRSVTFSPDGTRLVIGGDDKTAKLWDATMGRLLQILEGHNEAVYSSAFSPDGSRLATGGLDNVVKIWEVSSGDEILTLRGHSAGVICVAYSPDGRRLVSGSIDWTARVWDATALAESSDPKDGARP